MENIELSLYVHANKEHAIEVGEAAGLTGWALQMFKHCGAEHKMTYAVDPATGMAMLIAVDGFRVSLDRWPQ